MMHIPRVSVASALVLAGVLAYAASAAAQKPSLNDIAKQESDRRKAVAAPGIAALDMGPRYCNDTNW